MSHFEKYSAYYDVLYQDKNYQKETDYIFEVLSENHENLKSLIEFGSGSGKHAELFAKKGLRVDGVDLSQSMVDVANLRREQSLFKNQLHFQTGDMRNVSLPKKADALISLFHVVSYLTKDQDIMMAFKNIRSHLESGGLFFFDFWYKPAVLHFVPEYREKSMQNEKYQVFRKSIPEHLPNQNMVKVKFEVEVIDIQSGMKEQLSEVHPMRYFDLCEINNFLEKCGFSMIESHEWITKNRPSENTWGVAVLARAI